MLRLTDAARVRLRSEGMGWDSDVALSFVWEKLEDEKILWSRARLQPRRQFVGHLIHSLCFNMRFYISYGYASQLRDER